MKAQLTDGSLFLTAEIIMIGEREMVGGSYSRQPLTSGEIVTSHNHKIFQAMLVPFKPVSSNLSLQHDSLYQMVKTLPFPLKYH